MCDYTQGIKFCSCNAEKIREKGAKDTTGPAAEGSPPATKGKYIWQLFRRQVSSKDVQTLGEYMLPQSDLGQGLQADWIASQLNERNCFDFDYHPAEGDNLQITENFSMSPYLSFLYKKGRWVVDHYNPLESDLKMISDGPLSPIE
jgi:hypothetical protein